MILISFTNEIKEGLRRAFDELAIVPDLETELSDVFNYFDYSASAIEPTSEKEHIRLIDAISDGLRQSMEIHSDLVIMGQDIAEYGGVFKITENFIEQFGKDRVRNTGQLFNALGSPFRVLAASKVSSDF